MPKKVAAQLRTRKGSSIVDKGRILLLILRGITRNLRNDAIHLAMATVGKTKLKAKGLKKLSAQMQHYTRSVRPKCHVLCYA